jgi:hypothetical protein
MSSHEFAFTEIPLESVESFGSLIFGKEEWDLSHLDSFAFQYELEPGLRVVVVVLFSCHCFTHGFERDTRAREEIPFDEIYDDGREQRVLCRERYDASKRLLRRLIVTLAGRHIIVANQRQQNFVTIETTDNLGRPAQYAVFFEVFKDKFRRGPRLTLRVQSAYVLDRPFSKRQSMAKKVTLRTILRAALEGRSIRP